VSFPESNFEPVVEEFFDEEAGCNEKKPGGKVTGSKELQRHRAKNQREWFLPEHVIPQHSRGCGFAHPAEDSNEVRGAGIMVVLTFPADLVKEGDEQVDAVEDYRSEAVEAECAASPPDFRFIPGIDEVENCGP
jgi:hypothetical protein